MRNSMGDPEDAQAKHRIEPVAPIGKYGFVRMNVTRLGGYGPVWIFSAVSIAFSNASARESMTSTGSALRQSSCQS